MLFRLGSSIISWCSRKKSSITLRMTEAKYIATCSACSEAVWLRKMLVGQFDKEVAITDIHCNNHSCIKMIENPTFHEKTKHIKVRYHYIRDMVQKGAVKLKYVATKE